MLDLILFSLQFALGGINDFQSVPPDIPSIQIKDNVPQNVKIF